ncbi:putative Pre-mRNA-splicing factor prp1 [Saccharata proteae CBS 121410]|uniref:Pre-mRNA-splicing factor prp1 n=1 Tax=Saccharata proteae CBS 121410 TaxID=1314787 RepID=A0A9P4HXX6_9PEZI|nr:putative Pre-mRNA-splicing factor prp1 [Saccharata proteae CBS 121410]
MSARRDFLNQPAPENYVAGLGRGATGFTTRSDLGPAREGPSEAEMQQMLAKRAQQLGAAVPTAYGASERKDDDDDDDRFQDPDNETGLFANGSYDRDDDEADRIYQFVDEKMEKRRQRQREAREKAEREEYERNNPKIQQQFADLKRALGSVSTEEWANLPEVGDLTGKNRRSKQNLRQRFYAVPDSVIAGARDSTQLDTSISADGDANGGDTADGTMTNFADIGAAQKKVLQVRLDQANQSSGTETSAGTSTSVDPKGYLTSLQKSEGGEINVGDVKRVRELLESVIRTNPKHGPGWIAAARLEEVAGRIVAGRNVIARGCEFCPKSIDCWLENIRLNDTHNAKIIAANAIRHNNQSARLWQAAADLETDTRAKKRVFRQALDAVPQSVALWKSAIALEEDPADARLMLAKATELIPLSVELWLALARLETQNNAQVVLNKARKAIPTSHEIWIAAAILQEQMGQPSKVSIVMKKGIMSLAKESAMLKREEWIQEAEKAEEEGMALTCQAIINETLGWTLDEDDDRRDVFLEDAKSSIGRGKFTTARAIYGYTLRLFPTSKEVWQQAIQLERNHGGRDELWQLFDKAVEACPHAQDLWLFYAREREQSGEVHEARMILAKAFAQNPDAEDIWLAATNLEADAGDYDKARKLFEEAREVAATNRIWYRSVAFERQRGNVDAALDLVQQGLAVFPKEPKLYMQKGQIYESLNKLPQAREAYMTGTRQCPKSVPLYLLLSRLEEKAGLVVKARSVLDRARLAVKKNPELWCESVRLERRAGNTGSANQIMAQALQEVPNSGLLWTEKIWHLESRTQRKPRSLEAIKKVDNDPILFTTVARIFWGERRLEKAASWFEKAIVADSDMGDVWAWYYKFLIQHGTDEKREDTISKCVMNEPKHGEVWQSVAKDPKNVGKSIEEILKIVVTRLE